jgi:hypothetical protein
MTVLRDLFVSNDFIQGVIFHTSNKIDLLRTPSIPEGIIGIAAVIGNNGSRGEMQLPSDSDIGHLSLAEEGKLGQVSIVVEDQMEFDRPLGSSEMRPVKHAHTQIDGGGIKANQFILEPELLSSSSLQAATFQEFEKDLLIEFPGTMLVGIGQSGTIGSGDGQMFELALTASQAPGNLPQGMSSAQLTEEHSHKLAPTSEPSGMSLSSCLHHCPLELDSRKQL